jgi:small subunit ribosomal protein S16
MLVIRLRRIGKKNNPTYRVVVAEHTYPVDGKFTADLGFYNPHTKQHGLNLDEVKVWLTKGAKPSNTVSKILEGAKLKHKSIVVEKRNRKPKSEQPAEQPKATPAVEEAAEEQTEAPVQEAAAEEVVEASPTPVEEPTQEEAPVTPEAGE